VGYSTRAVNAAAVGLELDLTNDTGVDAVPGTNMEQALRILSAGSKKVAEGIYLGRIFSGGEFARAISIDNSYSSRGLHIKGPSNHIALVPNADDGNPMLVGRNAADSSTQWSVANDGGAQFSTIRVGPATTGYVAAPAQNLINDSVNSVGTLNAVHSATLLGLNQNNTIANQIGTYGVSASEHTSSSKPYVEGVEGDAYHQTAGSVDYLIGVAGYSNMSGAGGTVTNMMALYAFPNDRSTGTVTNNYGLFVDTQTVGTNNYSVYTAGTAPAKFGGPVISGLNAVSFSATPTFDARLGNTQKITLTGNVTSSTLSNASAGEQINFIICQDATGNRTFAWPSNMKGGMTIGATASKCSAQTFIFDGTNAYALSAGSANM